MRLYNPVDACFSQMPDITAFLESQPEFPPVPPQDQWDFFTITSPEDERFTYLKYELRRRAYYEDPTFADKLPADWRIKYPQWPGKSYISIPEEVRRRAQPELTAAGLQKRMADEIQAHSLPEEAYEAFRLCDATGEPLAYRHGSKTYRVFEIGDGMSPENLNEHLQAFVANIMSRWL